MVRMALFSAIIRRYTFILLRFPFLSHEQFISSEISPVFHLIYPYSCFSSHFSFLMLFRWCLFFLGAEITFSLLVLCIFRVLASMHSRYIHSRRVLFLLLFLTHTVSLYHRWYFLILRPICSISFLVQFKNSSEYLTKESAQSFISLIFFMGFGFEKFSRLSKVLVFNFFLHLHLFDGVRFQRC